jgi:hypothetical protein
VDIVEVITLKMFKLFLTKLIIFGHFWHYIKLGIFNEIQLEMLLVFLLEILSTMSENNWNSFVFIVNKWIIKINSLAKSLFHSLLKEFNLTFGVSKELRFDILLELHKLRVPWDIKSKSL